MMASKVLSALLLGGVWMILTNQVNLGSFLVGTVLGLALVLLFKHQRRTVRWTNLPNQVWGLIVYILTLYRDILFSGVDVARRALSKDMRLKPGMVTIPTQDKEKTPWIAALSANSFTMTPGEVVVEIEDQSVLLIHSLDVEQSQQNAPHAQAHRLKLLNQILGRSTK